MWLKSCVSALDCRVWDDSTQNTLSQQSSPRHQQAPASLLPAVQSADSQSEEAYAWHMHA